MAAAATPGTGSLDAGTAGNIADGVKILGALASIITGLAAVGTFIGAVSGAGSSQ
ncbi:hypothetical protein ACIGKR_16940 [Rhodococcus qingshengii]|uniref:hypothetical protein n=1 Tax=Rhodococcus erythropolis group TaxID=2840174 RepID=UPI0037A99300